MTMMLLSARGGRVIWSFSEKSMKSHRKSLRSFSSTPSGDWKKSQLKISLFQAFGISGAALCTGFVAGKTSESLSSGSDKNADHSEKSKRELPSGVPRSCCSCDAPDNNIPPAHPLTTEQALLPKKLAKIVGASNVLSGFEEDSNNTIYLKGARLGRGKALAIVTPTSLQEAVRALEVIVNSDCVVLPQGANTGLTGG